MLKFLRRNLPLLVLLLMAFTCLWILAYRHNHPNSRHWGIKNTSLNLWLPVQNAVGAMLAFPENILTALQELGHLRQEVSRLQKENQTLRLELSNHKSLQDELSRLKEVLQIKSRLPHQARIARIIAHDPSTWSKSFIIDLGKEDGVESDSPVISEQGIVGRVLECSAKYSRVLMISDTDSSVSGVDVRSRVNGVVQGTGLGPLRLGFVSPLEDIQVGDKVVSSGLGGVFPKGYALGTVVKKEVSDNRLGMEIELAPAVDLGVLDYVFILTPVEIFKE
jgi:rod shape-determining protein MreC